jgi:nitrite reductase/ring-hydroxylating ferredoxin subunit
MASADDETGDKEFLPAMTFSEITPGRVRIVTINGTEIALVRDGEAVYAVSNRCTHAGSSFAHGRAVGTLLTCPMHGARFDLRNGTCVNAPYSRLSNHAVRVVDGQVEVAISNPPD